MITIATNAVVAKIIRCPDEVKNLVTEKLSYLVEGAEFMTAFASGGWNGRSSFFARRTCTFPAGFVHLVHGELTRAGYRVHVVKKPTPLPLGPVDPIVDEHGNDDPRYDFQLKALHQVEKHGRGIIQVATGGGKCLGRDTPVLMYDGTIKMVQNVIVGDLLMGPDSKPRNVLSICAGRSPLYCITPVKGDPYVVNSAHILSLKKTSRGYRGRNRDGEKYPKGDIVNVGVEKYLAETKTFRHIHKGWRTGVYFASAASLPIDPYFVGLLLGDGSINGTVSLTTADPEMVAEVGRQASIWGLGVKGYEKNRGENKAKTYYLTGGRVGNRPNPLAHALRALGLGAGEKFIPLVYRTASRVDRLQMLAGIIDTDGYYDGKCLYLTLKEERLLDDVIFLARSLGLAAYKKRVNKTCCNNGKVGVYFATVLSGDIDEVPVRLERRKPMPRLQKKDHLVTGLKIEAIGEGDYFGFAIDGDHLFLLGDFTVTHNSKVAKLIAARYRRMTMFITTRGVLMYQMKDQLVKDCGFNVGIIGDGQWAPTRGINVGMVQTFVSQLATPELDAEVRAVVKQTTRKGIEITRKQALELAQPRFDEKIQARRRIIKLLEMVEIVIGEEAHEAGGNSYYEILKWCKNATIRVALTATPFMRADAEDNMRLMAAFGPILIKVSEKLLIDRGILAKPCFLYRSPPPHPTLRRTSPWQRAYKFGITENTFRNDCIAHYARRAAQAGLPVLVLVQRTEHGKILSARLQADGVRSKFIWGDHDQDERKQALRALAAGTLDVLIGSTILDVGVDVPSIGLVILAGGGKAEVALRQRIGRAARSKKHGPNVFFVLDFMDELNCHLRDHARERRSIIEATPGFAENILPSGADFPWELFPARKAA